MWFDEIMDDCKQALQVASHHKGIFIPRIVYALIILLFFVILFIGLVMFFVGSIVQLSTTPHDFEKLVSNLWPMIIGGIGIYLLLIVLSAAVEVGSIHLYKLAIEGIRPKTAYFFDGIKKHFFKVFGLSFLANTLFLILSPLILALFILYAVTIGILTSGWGITLLSILLGTYLNVWTIAVVVDDVGPFKALARSFKLGRKYFWAMFVLTLSLYILVRYLIFAFGLLVAAAVGWIIYSVIITLFKLVFVLVYRRKREELI